LPLHLSNPGVLGVLAVSSPTGFI
jgi:hypothetical protein